jgi:hypothetical protein
MSAHLSRTRLLAAPRRLAGLAAVGVAGLALVLVAVRHDSGSAGSAARIVDLQPMGPSPDDGAGIGLTSFTDDRYLGALPGTDYAVRIVLGEIQGSPTSCVVLDSARPDQLDAQYGAACTPVPAPGTGVKLAGADDAGGAVLVVTADPDTDRAVLDGPGPRVVVHPVDGRIVVRLGDFERAGGRMQLLDFGDEVLRTITDHDLDHPPV